MNRREEENGRGRFPEEKNAIHTQRDVDSCGLLRSLSSQGSMGSERDVSAWLSYQNSMRTTTRIGIFILSVLLTGAMAWSVSSEETGVVLHLSANCANYPPFKWQENGMCVGMDVDVVKEVCRRAGVTAEISHRPWKRVIEELKYGDTDGAFSAFRTEEREAFAHFLLAHPVRFSTMSVFVKAGHEFSYEHIEDLYGKTIGKNRGFNISEAFDTAEHTGKILIEEVDTTEQNIHKLTANYVDAFVANEDVTLYLLKQMGMSDQIVVLPTPVQPPRGAYLIISKAATIPKKDELLQKMDAVLQEMKEDGTLQRIHETYLK